MTADRLLSLETMLQAVAAELLAADWRHLDLLIAYGGGPEGGCWLALAVRRLGEARAAAAAQERPTRADVAEVELARAA